MGFDHYLYKITREDLDHLLQISKDPGDNKYDCDHPRSFGDWKDSNQSKLLVKWRKEYDIDDKIMHFKDLKVLDDIAELYYFKKGFTAIHKDPDIYPNLKFPRLSKKYFYLYFRSP